MIKFYIKQDTFHKEIYDVIRTFFPKEKIVKSTNLATDINELLIVCNYYEAEPETFIFDSEIIKRGICIAEAQITSKADCGSAFELKRTIKNGLKLCVYDLLSKHTGKVHKWGTLTGVRPTRLVHMMLDKGMSDEAILKEFDRIYRLSEEKAKLITDIAKTQRPYIDAIEDNVYCVYIHIPICTTKCLYCSFPSETIERASTYLKDYLDCLDLELQKTLDSLYRQGKSVDTIYIGGGTPTSIPAMEFKRLLEIVNKHVYKPNTVKEYTVEAGRPDSIDDYKLNIMKEYGVSRVSINPQTMNQKTLDKIGRCHSVEQLKDCYYKARELNFDCINMDVIIGLPGEGEKEVIKTMEEISKLKPDNLTVHALSIKRASILNEALEDYNSDLPEEGAVDRMADICRNYTASMGLRPYYLYRQKSMLDNLENIGYSKAGKEGLYNIYMMEDVKTVIAFGAGASSKIYYPQENRLERVFNVKNINEYIARIEEMIRRKKDILNI